MKKSCFLYVGSATEPVLSQLHRNCSKWLFTSGELSVQRIAGVRCNCIMNQTKPKMPRNITHTSLCVLDQVSGATCPVLRTWTAPLPCSLAAQCPRVRECRAEFCARGLRGERHRGLAQLTARGSRAPGKQVPLSLHRLHLCHAALAASLSSSINATTSESESLAKRDIHNDIVSVYA